jgi:hypothetical protein
MWATPNSDAASKPLDVRFSAEQDFIERTTMAR